MCSNDDENWIANDLVWSSQMFRENEEAIKTATVSPQSRNSHDTNEVNRPVGKASLYNSRQQRGKDNLNIFPLLISRTYKPLLTFLLCYALLPSFLLLDKMPGPSSNPLSLSPTVPHKLKIEERWKYQVAFIKKCQMADTKQERKNAKQSLKFMPTLFKSSAIFLSLSGFSRVFIGYWKRAIKYIGPKKYPPTQTFFGLRHSFPSPRRLNRTTALSIIYFLEKLSLFAAVKGCTSEKFSLKDILEPLKKPEQVEAMNGYIVRNKAREQKSTRCATARYLAK